MRFGFSASESSPFSTRRKASAKTAVSLLFADELVKRTSRLFQASSSFVERLERLLQCPRGDEADSIHSLDGARMVENTNRQARGRRREYGVSPWKLLAGMTL